MEEQAKFDLVIDDKRINHDVQTVQDSSPNAVVMRAMNKGYPPEFIEKIMGLQERFEANEARKAYFESLAEFRKIAPPVRKDKYNKYFDSHYTSLGNLLETYNPVLGSVGLSPSFSTPEQTDKTMRVECRLSHQMGHSESIGISAPIDQAAVGKVSGQRSRNPIQDIKSTFTYLRSATFEAILGVSGTEASSDDDGNSAGAPDTTKYDEWVEAFNNATIAGIPGLIKFWKENGKIIQKECGAAPAGKIYDMVVNAKKEMAAPEPGSLTE